VRNFGRFYIRGLGMAVRSNSLAYGYSVTSTAAFGVLADTASPASVGRIFLYLLGNGITFAAIGVIVTGGFRRRVEREPQVILALASSFGVLSIAAGVGAAALIGSAIGGWSAWLLGPLAASGLYLTLTALEIAGARALHLTVSDEDPEKL
jgi:hypothetical protein